MYLDATRETVAVPQGKVPVDAAARAAAYSEEWSNEGKKRKRALEWVAVKDSDCRLSTAQHSTNLSLFLTRKRIELRGKL